MLTYKECKHRISDSGIVLKQITYAILNQNLSNKDLEESKWRNKVYFMSTQTKNAYYNFWDYIPIYNSITIQSECNPLALFLIY